MYLVFVDLEKAFDRVTRVLIESSVGKKGVVVLCERSDEDV